MSVKATKVPSETALPRSWLGVCPEGTVYLVKGHNFTVVSHSDRRMIGMQMKNVRRNEICDYHGTVTLENE